GGEDDLGFQVARRGLTLLEVALDALEVLSQGRALLRGDLGEVVVNPRRRPARRHGLPGCLELLPAGLGLRSGAEIHGPGFVVDSAHEGTSCTAQHWDGWGMSPNR